MSYTELRYLGAFVTIVLEYGFAWKKKGGGGKEWVYALFFYNSH